MHKRAEVEKCVNLEGASILSCLLLYAWLIRQLLWHTLCRIYLRTRVWSRITEHGYQSDKSDAAFWLHSGVISACIFDDSGRSERILHIGIICNQTSGWYWDGGGEMHGQHRRFGLMALEYYPLPWSGHDMGGVRVHRVTRIIRNSDQRVLGRVQWNIICI